MTTQIIEFDVAMDAEQKALKNTKHVELTVNMDVDEATIIKHAIANYKVQCQASIRSNWTAFDEGKCPTEVNFGDALFAGGRKTTVKVLNPEEMLEYIQNMEDGDEKTAYLDGLKEMLNK